MSSSGMWRKTQECRSGLGLPGRGGAGDRGAGVGVDAVEGADKASDSAGVLGPAGALEEVAIDRVAR